jgi:hypothetical protein
MQEAYDCADRDESEAYNSIKVMCGEVLVLVEELIQAERDALRTAIEAAEKPVAWQGVHDHTDLYYRKPPQADVRPLYTTPLMAQPAVPLTREQVKGLCKSTGYDMASMQERLDFICGIRHAEAAHGIGEKK